MLTCPVCKGAKFDPDCGNCDGRGTVAGVTVPDHGKCPECEGKGYVEVKVAERPTPAAPDVPAQVPIAGEAETEGETNAANETDGS